MDNKFVIIKREYKSLLNDDLKRVCPDIRFTMEGRVDCCLSFLDDLDTRQQDGSSGAPFVQTSHIGHV